MTGYFSVNRSLLLHELWLRDEFSRGQAWIDLIGLAQWHESYIRIAGERMALKRGQCGWSTVSLAERWKWSRGKVLRFIDELKRDSRIVIETNNRTTIITICNYDEYQNKNTTYDTPNGTTERSSDSTTDGHQTVQQTDTNNKDNKINKDNKEKKESKNTGSRFTLTHLPPEWKSFCNEKRPELDAEETFQAFKDWWSAVPGQKGKKLDWLATWRTWVRNQHAPKIPLPQKSTMPLADENYDQYCRRLGIAPEPMEKNHVQSS